MGASGMQQDGRGAAPELDLTRMITRPGAPASAVWLPLAGLIALAVIAIPVALVFKSDVGTQPQDSVAVQMPAPEEVSRAAASLLETPQAVPPLAGPPVSQQVRRPIRLTDRSAKAHDLLNLTREALEQFGYRGPEGDPLQRILVRTLAEGQSDAYIDAALNAALARGDFAAPAALTTPFGELDTNRLLFAVLQASQS